MEKMLEQIMDPDYWRKNQKESLSCIDFCKKYFPMIRKAASNLEPKVLCLENRHYWIELLHKRKRFIVDAAEPFIEANGVAASIQFHYVGYLSECPHLNLKCLYENGEPDDITRQIEEKSKSAE